MFRLSSLASLFGVVLVALASAENTTLTTPSTPICVCAFNVELLQSELLCQATRDSNATLFSIASVVQWNCTYVKIDVSNHDVESIPGDAFESTPDLQIVHLYSDSIHNIDSKAFRGLKSLIDVDLSDNNLVTIDADLFADNPMLTKVSLSDNPLVELKQDFRILKSDSITDLDLSFCQLTKLTSDMFSGLPNLQNLDLSSNNIQEMSLTALETMPKLTSLDIGNNRWVCGCAFRDVLEFSRGLLPKSTTEISEVRCYGRGNILVVWNKKLASEYVCPVKFDVEEDDDYYFDVDLSSEEESVFVDEPIDQRSETTEAVDVLEDEEKLVLETNVVLDKTNALIEALKNLTKYSKDLSEDTKYVVVDDEELLEDATFPNEDYSAFTEDSYEPTKDKTILTAEDPVNEIDIVFVDEQGGEMAGAEDDQSYSYLLPGVLVLTIVIIVGIVMMWVVMFRLKSSRQQGDWSLLIEDGKEDEEASINKSASLK